MVNRYPGYNLPLVHQRRYDEPQYPIGTWHDSVGVHSEVIAVREIAMMIFMDRITDKPDWNYSVFDDATVAEWRAEALHADQSHQNNVYWEITDGKTFMSVRPPHSKLINDQAFDYCIAELRTKAEWFERSEIVVTLDTAGNSIAKSDILVPHELRTRLRAAFDSLQAEQSEMKWHLTTDTFKGIVDPNLFPFVYGTSLFLEDEVVGVADAIEKWANKGEAISPMPDAEPLGSSFRISNLDPDLFSKKYQWLPANIVFQPDGSAKFTSYINNIHPGKYPQIYQAIEKLIEIALPAWDQCLPRRDPETLSELYEGRREERIPKHDFVPDDGDEKLWEPEHPDIKEEDRFGYLDESNQELMDELMRRWLGCRLMSSTRPTREDIKREALNDLRKHYEENRREPIAPGPRRYEPLDYSIEDGESLRERFAQKGLQIVVEMTSIELTPDKPESKQGTWHGEGRQNEHICATALFYLDSENLTDHQLSFRMATSFDQSDDLEKGDASIWVERIYGTSFEVGTVDSECIQNYGSVVTKSGRLIAFPNNFQRRESAFQLKNPNKPGRCRIIALHLVDPFVRIISTANVPPQRLDWFLEALQSRGDAEDATKDTLPAELRTLMGLHSGSKASDDSNTGQHRLPNELFDMLRENGPVVGLMSTEQAKHHWLERTEEMTRHYRNINADMASQTYC